MRHFASGGIACSRAGHFDVSRRQRQQHVLPFDQRPVLDPFQPSFREDLTIRRHVIATFE